MAKSFYTIEEVCEKLHMTDDQVKHLVREGQLREFRDAGKVNYKAEEVDAIAPAADDSAAGASGELVLEPADDTGTSFDLAGSTPGLGSGIDLAGSSPGLGSDVLSLEEADADDTAVGAKAGDKKDDTVVTSVGVSVFDEDEDELADVDPLAATVVSEGAAGLGIEGIGSGSGLLDLTRESDDTSLGADLLDEIYPEDEAGAPSTVEMGEATRAGLEGAITEEPAEASAAAATGAFEPAAEPVTAARTRTVVEYGPDAASTGLTGILAVATAVMCIAGLAAASMMQGVWPDLMEVVYEKLWIFGAASAGAALAAMGIGFMLGKRSEG
ncbi:MAG: helix-turn-helix domain-containing protein [Phycisphaerae bacterium]